VLGPRDLSISREIETEMGRFQQLCSLKNCRFCYLWVVCAARVFVCFEEDWWQLGTGEEGVGKLQGN
jgi:hypothetical protein